jgi:hypothetical protein
MPSPGLRLRVADALCCQGWLGVVLLNPRQHPWYVPGFPVLLFRALALAPASGRGFSQEDAAVKVFLLIYMISLRDSQQPNVQKLEQPDMPSCQAQAKGVMKELSFKMTGDCAGPGAMCSPPYIVRTQCVTAVQ